MMIAFSNTKGGTGKSTLAAHLALWLFDRGIRVALLDADPQATSARWIQAAEPQILVRIATDSELVRQARQALLETAEIVVADTPGSNSESAQAVTLLSDLCIVPLQPSKPDLRAIKEALKFARLAQEVSGKPELKLVFTFTAKGDVQTRRLRTQLAELQLPVANCEIRRLNALRDACDSSVLRLSTREASAAAADIEALFQELLSCRLAKLPPITEVVNG